VADSVEKLSHPEIIACKCASPQCNCKNIANIDLFIFKNLPSPEYFNNIGTQGP
jgi:hypothetical protein